MTEDNAAGLKAMLAQLERAYAPLSTCAQCGHEYPNASAARYCCTDKPRPWDDGDW